jgi:hypothetical protein
MEDSLKIVEQPDGSFQMDWDKADPNWAWMNGLTNEQVQIIIKQAIESSLEEENK